MDSDESKLNSPHCDCNSVGSLEDKTCGWTDQQTNMQIIRERSLIAADTSGQLIQKTSNFVKKAERYSAIWSKHSFKLRSFGQEIANKFSVCIQIQNFTKISLMVLKCGHNFGTF